MYNTNWSNDFTALGGNIESDFYFDHIHSYYGIKGQIKANGTENVLLII
jgi:hypothetical protein